MISNVVIERVHHYVDDKNCDIAQRASSASQVREGFMSRRVDDEQTGYLIFLFTILGIFVKST